MNQKNILNIYTKKYLENMLKTFSYYKDVRAVNDNVNELLDNYKVLEKSYRNEYFYKNVLFNKIVLGKHSLNTTYALNEVVINKSKADMIVVNNNIPFIYEIKTELDNFEKLGHQINDYYKISSQVYVVTAESTYYPLYKILKGSNVGIYVLTKRNTLSLRKKTIENREFLDHSALFKLLRKHEYENIIMEYFGDKPNVNAFEYFTECLKLFREIDIVKAQMLVFNEIKKRWAKYEKEYIKQVPYELKWLVYSSRFNELAYKELVGIFKE